MNTHDTLLAVSGLLGGRPGGGGEAVLVNKTITENGTYDAEDDNADGYSSVTVDVASGGGDVVSGTSVAVDKTMVIPKVAGKSNFFACVEGVDSSYITEGAAMAAFRLAWLSETGVYSTKVTNAATTPPQVTIGASSAAFVTETVDSISIKFPNENTAGMLPDGTTVRYMWW